MQISSSSPPPVPSQTDAAQDPAASTPGTSSHPTSSPDAAPATTQTARADRFHALHRGSSPLLLVNAWDAASARIVEEAGAEAVATTSAGIAWSLGRPDGNALERSEAIAAIARIAAVVRVPLSADIEQGYAETAAGVGETVAAVLDTGAVGLNLEDGALSPAQAQARLGAARRSADRTGVRAFVNARIDVFLAGSIAPERRLAETLERATRFIDAGADGVFVPGVEDEDTIAALTAGIAAPLNLMIGAASPSLQALARLGVARVSLGSSVAQSAYAVAAHSARQLYGHGVVDALVAPLAYPALNHIVGGV